MGEKNDSELRKSGLNIEAINKLSSGLQEFQSDDLMNLRLLISEAIVKQEQMVSNLLEKNKCNELEENTDIIFLVSKAKSCDSRLRYMKRKMADLSSRTKSLKKRALHIHQTKQQETLNRIQEEDARLSREEQMIAKPRRDET